MILLLPLLMAAQLTDPVPIGHALVIENNSPGLVPSMKVNNVNDYAADLTFIRTAAYFPLLQSPTALTFSPLGDVYLSEYCEPSPCLQIVRYEQSGARTVFGAPIHDAVRAMEFIASGDLIVLLSGVLGRMDASGRWVQSVPLPNAIAIFGFDVAADQCTVALAALDRTILTNICRPPVPPRVSIGRAVDVRFLPDGEILAFDGLMALDPDATSFVGISGNTFARYDVATRQMLGGPAPLRNAVYGAKSIAIRGEWRAALHAPAGRRSTRR